MSLNDPKAGIREMFLRVANGATPKEDPQVEKYAERIKKSFKGISDDLAIKMARDTVKKHVRA